MREATVRVLPSNVAFLAGPEETVFEAADHQGVIWPSVCGGDADCTKCYMQVLEGEEHLSPMDERERSALDCMRWRGNPRPDERLACCTRVAGDVVVRRRSVRLRDAEGEKP